MECKLFKIVDLPTIKENEYNGIIIGHVLGLNINDEHKRWRNRCKKTKASSKVRLYGLLCSR